MRALFRCSGLHARLENVGGTWQVFLPLAKRRPILEYKFFSFAKTRFWISCTIQINVTIFISLLLFFTLSYSSAVVKKNKYNRRTNLQEWPIRYSNHSQVTAVKYIPAWCSNDSCQHVSTTISNLWYFKSLSSQMTAVNMPRHKVKFAIF